MFKRWSDNANERVIFEHCVPHGRIDIDGLIHGESDVMTLKINKMDDIEEFLSKFQN
jgi:hypothetical protein